MAGLTKKNGTWYATFKEGRKTVWKRIGKVSRKDALKVKRRWEEEADKGNLGLIEIKSITFSAFVDMYRPYCKANKAPRAVEREETCLVRLLPIFGNLPLSSITEAAIERYKRIRLSDGVKPKTITIELYCLSGIMRKAVEWNYLRAIPKIVPLKYELKPPRYLTADEIELLLRSASPWLCPALIVLLNTGLRISELCRLKWKDIDWDNGSLTINNSKKKGYRTIPMNNGLETVLCYLKSTYINDDGIASTRTQRQMEYVFCHANGSPLKSFRTSIRNAAAKAGLKGVSAHTMRHTFASHLVMAGVDLPTVKELLGHSSIATTMIYAHLSVEHKAAAVRKLPWLVKKEEDKE